MSGPQLEIRIVPVTPLQQNACLVWDKDTKEGLFVDPGGDVDRLMGAASEFGVKIGKILLTHGHLDHAGGAEEIREKTGCVIEGPHRDDQFLLDSLEQQGATYGIPDARNVVPDRYLEDGDMVSICGVDFGVSLCPGHTPGHVIFHHQPGQLAFVGDVLFRGSIGRTDLPGGNHQDLLESIVTKLWPLGDGMRFIPGHGPASTFGQERQDNAFVADAILAAS
ncbi:MAG: MBL fold metallo-hydrolase [Pseudomonadota bacterium]